MGGGGGYACGGVRFGWGAVEGAGHEAGVGEHVWRLIGFELWRLCEGITAAKCTVN